MTNGRCKNCKLPIEDDVNGFCDNDDLCWTLWADKVLGKEMKKVEIKEHDPLQEFRIAAEQWIDWLAYQSASSISVEREIERLAKLLADAYNRGITDGIEMGKMEAAEDEARKCSAPGLHDGQCIECIRNQIDQSRICTNTTPR